MYNLRMMNHTMVGLKKVTAVAYSTILAFTCENYEKTSW
jgi:hypothetical protein